MPAIGSDMPRGPKRHLTTTPRSISDPCLPSSALHGPYCLSLDFTWSAKLVLEKQTYQPDTGIVNG